VLSGNSKSCSLGTAEGAVREQQKLFPGNSKSILWEQQKYSLGTAKAFPGNSKSGQWEQPMLSPALKKICPEALPGNSKSCSQIQKKCHRPGYASRPPDTGSP